LLTVKECCEGDDMMEQHIANEYFSTKFFSSILLSSKECVEMMI
jgi:hypothetical protein